MTTSTGGLGREIKANRARRLGVGVPLAWYEGQHRGKTVYLGRGVPVRVFTPCLFTEDLRWSGGSRRSLLASAPSTLPPVRTPFTQLEVAVQGLLLHLLYEAWYESVWKWCVCGRGEGQWLQCRWRVQAFTVRYNFNSCIRSHLVKKEKT